MIAAISSDLSVPLLGKEARIEVEVDTMSYPTISFVSQYMPI
jgi:hypothetical protein